MDEKDTLITLQHKKKLPAKSGSKDRYPQRNEVIQVARDQVRKARQD